MNCQLNFLNIQRINFPAIQSLIYHKLAQLKMKKKSQETEIKEEYRRRSERERTPRKYDYFAISTGRYEDLGGLDLEDDDYEPKREKKRKHRKDSEDFDNSEKKYRKKMMLTNRISHLLEWKQNSLLPEVPQNKQSRIHQVKSILNTDLSKYGSQIEALFINIQWQQDKKQGITIKDFRKIQIENKKLMSKGIVFLWAQKELIGQLMDIMEQKGFVYVENFQIVHLSLQKGLNQLQKSCTKQIVTQKSTSKKESGLKGVCDPSIQELERKQEFLGNLHKLGNLQANKILLQKDGQYLKKSKKILLMFRKHDNKKDNLQLRHQRTCDVLFDLVVPQNVGCDVKTKNYIYKMIQTLLPRSLENLQFNSHLSMMQLWGDKNSHRKGWIILTEK